MTIDDLFPIKRNYRPGEVAKGLGVHIETVRRMTQDGRLEAIRIGGQRRIPYLSLKNFILTCKN